jgi:hypothetical protein
MMFYDEHILGTPLTCSNTKVEHIVVAPQMSMLQQHHQWTCYNSNNTYYLQWQTKNYSIVWIFMINTL